MKVFTFYEPQPGDAEVKRALCAWKASWQCAGYRPILVNEEFLRQGRDKGGPYTAPGDLPPPYINRGPYPEDSYFRDMGACPLSSGVRSDGQGCWHKYLAPHIVAGAGQGATVLDVGSGHGRSAERMGKAGLVVTTQDIAQGCTVDLTTPVHLLPSKAYDVVTAFDVVEHIRNATAFVEHMRRIARKAILITTPNWLVLGNRHVYHYREFTPAEAVELMGGPGAYLAGWAMMPDGTRQVNAAELADALDCYNFAILAKATP